MERPEIEPKPQLEPTGELSDPVNSYLPYDEIAAYQSLRAAGLPHIESPRIVNDSYGDLFPEWKEVKPPVTKSPEGI